MPGCTAFFVHLKVGVSAAAGIAGSHRSEFALMPWTRCPSKETEFYQYCACISPRSQRRELSKPLRIGLWTFQPASKLGRGLLRIQRAREVEFPTGSTLEGT